MTAFNLECPSDFVGALRDWSVSHAVDDVAATAPELQQPSWNWHSLYAALGAAYPLTLQPVVDGTPSSGSVVAGGADFFNFGVPAGGTATLTLRDASTTAGTNLQFVVVRIR